jgi:cell fate regulator YaaT (PSP1 superfamily)
MACTSCNSNTKTNGLPSGCNNNGACGNGGCNKLNVFDWLANMADIIGNETFPFVEVRFKNSRKDFYSVNNLKLYQGDVVVVESASTGYDVGVISLSGQLVGIQMNKKGVDSNTAELKKILRKATDKDIQKWIEARELETPTMHRARTIAASLNLQMKISDVEYQGDKTKATFYYTADERVDFRELIKIFAAEFKVKIEMRQIGARQEAGRLGGIGSCGRELCCSTWLTDFRTVNTSAARYQQLSLNPQKLAGQCGKLKCCLNYELDTYVEALKEFPDTDKVLQTKKGNAKHQKTDIFKRIIWYTYENDSSIFYPISVEKVKEIIKLNTNGQLPENLEEYAISTSIAIEKEPDYENVVGQDSLERFDDKLKKDSNQKRDNKNNTQQNNQANKSDKKKDSSNKNKQSLKKNKNKQKSNNNQNPNKL